MLLALDTSTAWAGIALHGPAGPEASAAWRAERAHTTQLLPAVERLMASRGATPGALSGVAIATGPGSFTGIRVGLATAKGIALALGVPLIGVPTLLWTAWPHRDRALPIRAVLELGRGRLAVAEYESSPCGLVWRSLRSLTPEELASAEAGRVLYCGELAPSVAELLRERQPEALVPVSDASPRDPGVLAAMGWARLQRGDVDDPDALQAEYVSSRKQ